MRAAYQYQDTGLLLEIQPAPAGGVILKINGREAGNFLTARLAAMNALSQKRFAQPGDPLRNSTVTDDLDAWVRVTF
jgi:hypothetical protein